MTHVCRAAHVTVTLVAALIAASLAGPADLGAEVVGRASVASDGTQANGASFQAAISADGRVVAFESLATNLVPSGCTIGGFFSQIFVRNRQTGTTTCLSVAPNGTTPGDHDSRRPALSADGRFVAFDSFATNLVASGCTTGVDQVFVHDRLTATTTCVSLAPDGTTPGNHVSFFPALSADGRFLAFASVALNLVPSGCITGFEQLFVRDRQTGTTTCLSVAPDGTTPGNNNSSGPVLSTDGRFVAFYSYATNLVASGCTTSGFVQVFVRDRLTGTTTCLSLAPDGTTPGNGASFGPALSADGRFVAFESFATNLVASGCTTGPNEQIFVRDRLTGTTTCLSLAPDGITPGNGSSVTPALSADGRMVVIYSGATNLVPGDTNGVSDIFIARLPVGPTWLVTGAGPGGGPHVRGFDATGAGTLLSLFPYPVGFTGGAHVATGNVAGDGAARLITGAGPGGGSHVRVFADSTASRVLTEFFAYPVGFTGGVFVAAGDVDGSGRAAIITGAGPGGGPHVRVLTPNPDGSLTELASFFAYPVGFTGGAAVAACDVDGSGRAAIITGAGPGGGPHVRVLKRNPDGSLTELASFFAYPVGFTGGVTVACGDVDGSGRAAIITGAGPGGGPHVRVLKRNPDGSLTELASFFAYPVGFTGGVTVAAGDVDGEGQADIITGAGPGGGPHVRVLKRHADGSVTELASFFAYSVGFTGGVFVAGIQP